ncbi:hypothetical protein ACFLYA_00380 [Candidatus Dependentiae bacterium]
MKNIFKSLSLILLLTLTCQIVPLYATGAITEEVKTETIEGPSQKTIKEKKTKKRAKKTKRKTGKIENIAADIVTGFVAGTTGLFLGAIIGGAIFAAGLALFV